MKTSKLTWGLLIAATFTVSTQAVAQEKKKSEQPDPKQIQKAMEEFARPGKEHAHLKRLAGHWKCEVTSYFPDPAKPTKTKGVAVIRSVMGGRFIQQSFRTTMDGKPFTGMGISGYDKLQKKYVGSWIDNGGTAIMPSSGTYDVKTQTLTESATSATPFGEMKMKMVSKYLSNDKFTFTMSVVAEQGEQKMMEIVYTRAPTRKKAGSAKAKKE